MPWALNGLKKFRSTLTGPLTSEITDQHVSVVGAEVFHNNRLVGLLAGVEIGSMSLWQLDREEKSPPIASMYEFGVALPFPVWKDILENLR